jgi:hypothetical protein
MMQQQAASQQPSMHAGEYPTAQNLANKRENACTNMSLPPILVLTNSFCSTVYLTASIVFIITFSSSLGLISSQCVSQPHLPRLCTFIYSALKSRYNYSTYPQGFQLTKYPSLCWSGYRMFLYMHGSRYAYACAFYRLPVEFWLWK